MHYRGIAHRQRTMGDHRPHASHMGSIGRGDDTIAAFSSRGPAALDHLAKPDVVAPGVGIGS